MQGKHWGAFVLAALIGANVASADPPPRYAALLVGGQRLQGNSLSDWHDANAMPRLDGQPLMEPANPLRWFIDRSKRLSERPTAYVETHTGDCLPGIVVDYRTGQEETYDPLPPHLLVRPSFELWPPDRAADDMVRVVLPMVRKIVWAKQSSSEYRPGTAFYRDGRMIEFRAARFSSGFVHLLLAGGDRRIAWGELAELHMPMSGSPWRYYFDELAASCTRVDSRLMQIETTGGLVATTSLERFKPRAEGGEPDRWFHGVQPAWSLDILWTPNRDIACRRFFLPTEVPLSRCLPTRVVATSLLGGTLPRPQPNRTPAGGPLRSAIFDFGWGWGVQALSELTFPLPPGVKALRTQVAIDRAMGKGGCVQAKIFANDAQSPPLWQSPVLVGSETVADSGPIALTGPAGGQNAVVLQIDPAHATRPPGADPFDIRDQADWLDPIFELDPAIVKQELDSRVTQQFAAWKDWSVQTVATSGNAASLEITTLRDERLPKPGTFHRGVAPREAVLVLSREVTIGPRDRWLVLAASRPFSRGAEPKLEVRIDRMPVAEFAVPERNGMRDDLRPLFVSLDGYQRAKPTPVEIEVRQTSLSPDSPPVEWRVATITEQLPQLHRIFDEPADLALLAAAIKPTLVDDRHYGEKAMRLAPNEEQQLKFAKPIAIREQPRWGESRALRFAFRKRGSGRMGIELQTDPPRAEPIRYDIGVGEPTRGKATRIWGEAPDQWIVVTRDVFGDFGSLDVTGISFFCPDGQEALVDHVYFGRAQHDFDALPAAPSLDRTNEKARAELLKLAVERIQPAMVTIQLPDQRVIGGVIIRRDEGEILAPAHALGKPQQEVKVTLADGKTLKGKTLGSWRDADLALVKLDEKLEGPAFAQVWPHEQFPLNEIYAAVTFPAAIAADGKPEAKVATPRRDFRGQTWIDVDSATYTPGGALVHRDGYLMGLHNSRSRFGGFLFTRTVQSQVDANLGRLRNNEVFGAWQAGAEPVLGLRTKGSAAGLTIIEAVPGTPAAKAGLQADDVLLKLDGKPIASPDQLQQALAERDAGQEITLDFTRTGAPQQAKATLTPRRP